jgi:integrase
VNRWLIPRLGGTKLPALTETQVRQAVADLAASGGKRGGPLSARSCQLALVTLRMAITYAIRQGWAVRNVAADVKVRPTRRRMSTWTPEQARAFLAAIRDDRDAALYTLALARGLRRGELAGLRWGNVDLDRGSLAIVETVVLVAAQPQPSTPKTTAGVRRIGLDPQLIDVLRAHRRRQLQERLVAGPAWTDSGRVFTDELGVPTRPDHITDRFRALCRQAKVPTIRLHDARHTAATLMLAGGVPTKVVSEILGHADTRITSDIYQHVAAGHGRRRRGEAVRDAVVMTNDVVEDLADFLSARIAEGSPPPRPACPSHGPQLLCTNCPPARTDVDVNRDLIRVARKAAEDHRIVHNNPPRDRIERARFLARVDSRYESWRLVVQIMAQPYVDHADFRPEWLG